MLMHGVRCRYSGLYHVMRKAMNWITLPCGVHQRNYRLPRIRMNPATYRFIIFHRSIQLPELKWYAYFRSCSSLLDQVFVCYSDFTWLKPISLIPVIQFLGISHSISALLHQDYTMSMCLVPIYINRRHYRTLPSSIYSASYHAESTLPMQVSNVQPVDIAFRYATLLHM